MDLAARLWAGILALLEAEIALAGAEARQAVRSLAAGLAVLGLTLVLALAAVVALTAAAGAALVEAGLSPALAALLVAAGALALGALCAWWALSRLARAAGMPARTVRNLRRDVETLATLVNRHA
jgi:uncharacterized membrane protein YqjE